jgi:hypothetical protein
MSRCVWSICLLLCLTNIAYSQNKGLQARKIRNPKISYAPAEKIRRYPLPVVNFEREGLARKGDQQEILNKIIYPVINKSRKPIAAIIVTFYPDGPNITVLVLWHGEDFRGQVIERNRDGHFDADAYKVFLEVVGS